MDRIDAMRVFVASVDRGSLAAAARSLGHSPATVTRAIALLETRLSTRLLFRSTRALRMTPVGESYLSTCASGAGCIPERQSSRSGPTVAR